MAAGSRPSSATPATRMRHETPAASSAPDTSTVASTPTDQNAWLKLMYRPGSSGCSRCTKGVLSPSTTPSPAPERASASTTTP